jgi:hypothetical protein
MNTNRQFSLKPQASRNFYDLENVRRMESPSCRVGMSQFGLQSSFAAITIIIIPFSSCYAVLSARREGKNIFCLLFLFISINLQEICLVEERNGDGGGGGSQWGEPTCFKR